jgi:ABC-2 type transport system ATP-binding protein
VSGVRIENVIEVMNLVHYYGERRAVDALTFSVEKGEVLGLLGPNGAGKTTTIRLLNGLFSPSSGRVSVMGLDPFKQGDEVRRQTGVLTETPALYERLTARQNLEFFGTLAGMSTAGRKSRIDELLSFFELQERANESVGSYSKGMKQRLALARTLLHRPPLVFLDEPTSGLDPEASQQVHLLIESIRKKNGQTVLLCTHNLYEAEHLCDRLAVINKGRLLGLGTLDELRRLVRPGLWLQVDLWAPLSDHARQALGAHPAVLQADASGDQSIRVLVNDRSAIPALITDLVHLGGQLLSVQPQPISLEEIYFTLQEKDREVHDA